MNPSTHERIAREFPAELQSQVTEALNTYAGPEPDQVHSAVLELSKGSLSQVRHFLKAAAGNYRDVLYWAGYYVTEPALTGRDPQELIKELVGKWAQGGDAS